MVGGNADELLAQLGPYVLNRREQGLAQLMAFVRIAGLCRRCQLAQLLLEVRFLSVLRDVVDE